MKVIFLDFDGVLNSYQENGFKRLRQRWSPVKVFREWLGSKLLGVCNKLKYDYPPKTLKDKWVNGLSKFALYKIVDHAEFCPIACANIQEILDCNPDVYLVISSTWRSGGLKEMKYILNRNHIDPSRCIDTTPHGKGHTPHGAPGDGKRGYQIQQWLNEKGGLWDVGLFAIIDDDADMAHLMPFLVNTDAKNGFMWTDLEKTIELLDGKLVSTRENKRLKRWGALGMLTGRV